MCVKEHTHRKEVTDWKSKQAVSILGALEGTLVVREQRLESLDKLSHTILKIYFWGGRMFEHMQSDPGKNVRV